MNGTLVQTPRVGDGAFSVVRLSPKGEEMARKFAEARTDFSASEWELARTLLYALALPWSFAWHRGEYAKVKPVFMEYKRQLEERVNPEIAAEMVAEGFGDSETLTYRKEFFKRLSEVRSKDDRYNELSRRMEEHQNGAQSAARLFMSYMTAWANELGISDDAFISQCSDIIMRLRLVLRVELPGNLQGSFSRQAFAAIYSLMKNCAFENK